MSCLRTAKKCPFCPAGYTLMMAQTEDSDWVVSCRICLACGPSARSKAVARRLWDQRKNPDGGRNG